MINILDYWNTDGFSFETWAAVFVFIQIYRFTIHLSTKQSKRFNVNNDLILAGLWLMERMQHIFPLRLDNVQSQNSSILKTVTI